MPRLFREADMTDAALMAEVRRGPVVESFHHGHAVIARPDGRIVESCGNPELVFLPRSAAKMLQALPLLETGAGGGLSSERLALACASHSGERIHVERVSGWLSEIGLTADALACGPQASRDTELATEMIRQGEAVTGVFNWCSGKHTGFLTVARHLGAGLDYVDPNHAVQRAIRTATDEMCGVDSPGFGIDGCSAPNFATTLRGMAIAMAKFASAGRTHGVRDEATARLRDAMIAHPDMVAGKGRADTLLMRATTEPVAIKSGAEGVHIAMLPEQGLGVALKISDGASRAAETAIAALLVRLGALEADHPDAQRYLNTPVLNWDGLTTGSIRPAQALMA
ncbi:MAG: asparaginase [Pseudomonadota bacterium]